jgi:putative DNA primase/helicase
MSDERIIKFVNRALAGDVSATALSTAIARVAARTESPPFEINQVPAFSEDWLALNFTERHRHDLRYCAAWNKWLQWDGTRWRPDATKQIFDLVRKICREVAIECNDLKVSKQVVGSKTVAGVRAFAEADRAHATRPEQWDTDPWLLNTPTGTIDLHTGERRSHAQADYITRITAIAPGGDCPLWHAFLDRVTGGDNELQRFLQRVLGYALTGLTIEHALFFLYGKGANGKSVFIKTVTGILAEYQRAAPIETFTASQSERHPTDLAGLRGARLVTAVETEDGRRWAENKIKALTGGDTISARLMRQDFFDFTPAFKLMVAGNHKPGLRSVDEAIKRRFNLIPFTVTIPTEERDPKLAEKLQAEWPGILQWMIDGCLEWQRIGLAAPAIVVEATKDYLDSEDAVKVWLEDHCRPKSDQFELRSTLYSRWKAWTAATGEDPRNAKWLYSRLESHPGVFPRIRQGARGFIGLQLLQDWERQE